MCSRGSPEAATKSQSATSPLPSQGPKRGRNCYAAPAFSGSPKERTKSQLAASPLPSRGPTRGWKCYVTRVFSGVPRSGDKITIGYLTPAFSGTQKRAELLQSPCVLGGPRKRGQNHNWLPHPPGAHKRVEMLRNPCVLGGPKSGDKITIGCLTPAFSGTQKRVELLQSPCVLGGPQKRGQNHNWLPHPCLLGGTKEGGNAT